MYSVLENMITVPSAEFNVESTIECGQFFRYEKTECGYKVESSDKTCIVTQSGDEVRMVTSDVGFFVNFFDLDRDVSKLQRSLWRFEELRPAIEKAGALHILRQPLFETIITFIISAFNNIPRIKGIIKRMCATLEGFPTPEKLAEVDVRQLESIGLGYRASYVKRTAEVCATTDVLRRVNGARTEDAIKMLMELSGVGQKVADCIALFSLSKLEVVPVDVRIFKSERQDKESEMQVRNRLMSRYGEYAGYAQQLIYYTEGLKNTEELNKKKAKSDTVRKKKSIESEAAATSDVRVKKPRAKKKKGD